MAGMDQICDFTHPVVMKWTALPARLDAKARLDPVFLQTLLADPRPGARHVRNLCALVVRR